MGKIGFFPAVTLHVWQIPKQKNDERNKIAVELVGVERFSDAQRLLGQTYLHLIDIIKVNPLIQSYCRETGLWFNKFHQSYHSLA